MKRDIVVIGGGIAGASAAYELADFAAVTLLDQESRCGYHSTGRSAASFTENYGSSVVRRLVIASREFLERPPQGFAQYPLLSPRGLITVARDDQQDLLAAELCTARAFVPSIVSITPAQARAHVPILRDGYVSAAIFEPHSREMDVDALHQGFLRGARARGARVVVGAPALGIARVDGRWHVTTPLATFPADVIVNAAGAWADGIAGLAGIAPLGLTPKQRTAFLVPAPDAVDVGAWPMVTDVGAQWYFKPSGGQLLASPADAVPTAPADVYADEHAVATGIDRLERATTLNVARVTTSWAGLRTFAADSCPVLGPEPLAPGFVWLAGQGGFGIKTSPALARACASLIRHDRLPTDLLDAGVTRDQLAPERLRGTA